MGKVRVSHEYFRSVSVNVMAGIISNESDLVMYLNMLGLSLS